MAEERQEAGAQGAAGLPSPPRSKSRCARSARVWILGRAASGSRPFGGRPARFISVTRSDAWERQSSPTEVSPSSLPPVLLPAFLFSLPVLSFFPSVSAVSFSPFLPSFYHPSINSTNISYASTVSQKCPGPDQTTVS